MRRFFAPRWLAWHVTAVAAVAAMLWLGHWQWTRAESGTGSPRSLAYSLQWVLFAGFAVFFWWRTIRDDALSRDGQSLRASEAGAATGRARDDRAEVDGLPVYVAPSVVEDEDDEELAAYNRMLADLAARAQRPVR